MSEGENHNGLAGSVVPAKLQRRAGRLLAAGATYEETLRELRRRGAEHLSLRAVQNFFRSSPEVQRERIERRRRAVEEMKRALTGPDPSRRSLAEAVLFTGLTELTWPTGVYHGQLNHYKLQLRTLRMKRETACLGQRVAETQLRLVRARWEMARLKLQELERELEQQFRQNHLGVGTMEKLRMIQGLIGNLPAAGRHRAFRPKQASADLPPAAEHNWRGEE